MIFHSPTSRTGLSQIESLLATALLLLLVTMMAGSLVFSLETNRVGSLQERAALLASEGMEAVRSIRDGDFSQLTDGTHGVAVSGSQWVLSGTSDTLGGFTRSIAISSVDSHTKRIDGNISWERMPGQQSSLAISNYLTNWSEISATQSDTTTIDVSSATLSGDNKELRNVEIANTGSSPIIITHIAVSWDPTDKKIERIRIDDDTVWSKNGPGSPTGTQDSGTLLDVQDYTVGANDNEDMDIKFTKSMAGATITMTLTLSDQSQKTVSISP